VKVDEAVREGNYSDGIAFIENGKKNLYRGQDSILYFLDKGMVAHYAGQYAGSSALLEDGERAIEEAYTKSVTAEIGSYLLNDTVRNYDGEDYEDIYINAFNALNYYYRERSEDAMVEIRRVNNKLRFLASKYALVISNLQKKALEDAGRIPLNSREEYVFSDSALARYLGLLFHRDMGQYDDARIDRDQLKIAFANAPEVYTHPVPSSIAGELETPAGMARLNVLAFSGLSPVKTAETLRIPVTNGHYVKIALPVLVARPSRVARIELVFDAGGVYELELLEDIAAVAGETFKQKKDLIYLKTVIRAVSKGLTSASLDAAADEVEDGMVSLILSVLSLGTQIAAEVSEEADLRLSRYFPGKAWVTGLDIKPGLYSFTVNYFDSSGGVIASYRKEDMLVQEHGLNLTEAVCLK
jgi:hypothetical protein